MGSLWEVYGKLDTKFEQLWYPKSRLKICLKLIGSKWCSNLLHIKKIIKFSTLFNKKHRTFFSQVFQVINKKYLTFLKCLSRYLIKSNPFFFIANNKYPTIFLQVFHII